MWEIAGYICLGIGSLIVLIHVGIMIGIFLSGRYARRIKDTPLPTISIIIPARNESKNLPVLFRSLEQQTVQDYEIIFIDDRSTDNTGDLLDAFAAKHPKQVKIIHNRKDPGKLNPKLNGLTLAEKKSTGEAILLTDADCELRPRWVESMARSFHDPRVGIVISSVIARPGFRFLNVFQLYEHLLRCFYAHGTAGMGLATGGFGNNMAVRRKALEDIGGYGNLANSVTEDQALIAAIRALGTWKVAAHPGKETLVITTPQDNWKDVIKQEIRWNAGGFFSPEFMSRLAIRGLLLYLGSSLFLIPLGFLHPLLWSLPAATLFTLFLMGTIGGIYTRQKLVQYWLPMPIYLLTVLFVYPILVFKIFTQRRIDWKGSDLNSQDPK